MRLKKGVLCCNKLLVLLFYVNVIIISTKTVSYVCILLQIKNFEEKILRCDHIIL